MQRILIGFEVCSRTSPTAGVYHCWSIIIIEYSSSLGSWNSNGRKCYEQSDDHQDSTECVSRGGPCVCHLCRSSNASLDTELDEGVPPVHVASKQEMAAR